MKFESESWVRLDTSYIINANNGYSSRSTYFIDGYYDQDQKVDSIALDIMCKKILDSLDYRSVIISFYIDKGCTNYTNLDWSELLVYYRWEHERSDQFYSQFGESISRRRTFPLNCSNISVHK